ncbi:MAG: phosphodiester glycosidase family protein [Alistipes sp.]|nr:phosphodiester glycosidase family protein [Alistipes sp.]
MKKIFSLAITVALFSATAIAQTPADSIAIVKAKWQKTKLEKGIVARTAQFTDLYKGPQAVSIIEVSKKSARKFNIAHDHKMVRTSEQAMAHNGVAAINGSYYDMKHGNSVCFHKIDDTVLDWTGGGERNTRVNGAVRTVDGKLEILTWTYEIEQGYSQNKGTVLASGPIMMKDGKMADFSECSDSFIETKHPRSAIFTTKDGNVVMVTVDGRSKGNSIGVSIPEFAHLVRVLGGYDAINLDGGGSTTLWLKGADNNGILNYPCDNRKFDHKGERRVSNIIYVY